MKKSVFAKILCLVLVLVMALSLVLCGCGKQEQTPEETTTAPTSGQSNSPYAPEDDEWPFGPPDPNHPNAIVLPEDREPLPPATPPTQPAQTESTEETVPAAPVEPSEPVSGGYDENALPDDRS